MPVIYSPTSVEPAQGLSTSQRLGVIVNGNIAANLRFNFGFLIEAGVGTSRSIELNYPSILLEADLTLTPLTGKFQAIRNSKGIYITGRLHSALESECARCLDHLDIPVSVELNDLYYYPPDSAPEGEYSVGEDGFLDLGPLVRQLSLLELPMQPFCRPDCKGLCSQCGQNLNNEQCDCVHDEIDPRLASLGKLLDTHE
jgi:uncharacterized protein